MNISRRTVVACAIAVICGVFLSITEKAQERKESLNLPTSKKLLLPAPGDPQKTNSFPTAAALSPDGKYLAILNNGYGTEDSGYQQSIAILDPATNKLVDFPDTRLGQNAHQTYFLGLAFSADGSKLYASISSLTDPTGSNQGDTGNGVAVYRFEDGRIQPEAFLKIPLAPLGIGKRPTIVTAGKEQSFSSGHRRDLSPGQ